MPVKSFLGPMVRCLVGPVELPKRLGVRRSLLGRAACRTLLNSIKMVGSYLGEPKLSEIVTSW